MGFLRQKFCRQAVGDQQSSLSWDQFKIHTFIIIVILLYYIPGMMQSSSKCLEQMKRFLGIAFSLVKSRPSEWMSAFFHDSSFIVEMLWNKIKSMTPLRSSLPWWKEHLTIDYKYFQRHSNASKWTRLKNVRRCCCETSIQNVDRSKPEVRVPQ